MEGDGAIESVEVGRYLRRNQAEERSLVLQAQRIPFRIEEWEGLYRLVVAPEHAEVALRELTAYEAERQAERQQRIEAEEIPVPRFRKRHAASLLVYIWVMIGFFIVQAEMSAEWTRNGTASSSAILNGEVWRSVTALTLHADSGHLVANICVGLLFAGALLPLLGTGWTWMAIVLSGTIGNLLNAWAYRTQEHYSVGASTAVFGALGLIVAWQLVATIRSAGRRRPTWRELIVPLAAGLALLAYLGVGDGSEHSRVDVMAHLFGMIAGFLLGLILSLARLPERTPATLRRILPAVALALIGVAWYAAMRVG